jgi:hypothetical protein
MYYRKQVNDTRWLFERPDIGRGGQRSAASAVRQGDRRSVALIGAEAQRATPLGGGPRYGERDQALSHSTSSDLTDDKDVLEFGLQHQPPGRVTVATLHIPDRSPCGGAGRKELCARLA